MVSFAISVMRFLVRVAAITTSARTVRTTTGMMKVSSLELIFFVFFSIFFSPAKLRRTKKSMGLSDYCIIIHANTLIEQREIAKKRRKITKEGAGGSMNTKSEISSPSLIICNAEHCILRNGLNSIFKAKILL